MSTSKTPKKYFYAGNCVGLTRRQADALYHATCNAKDITRKTFLMHTSRHEVSIMEMNLGYAHHNSRTELVMANDWHVSYYKGKLCGKTAYWFKWSGIEYIFTEDGTIGC